MKKKIGISVLIASLLRTVKSRGNLGCHCRTIPEWMLLRAERTVCHAARALFSNFVDEVLWSTKKVDAGIVVQVRYALLSAAGAVSFDSQCKIAIARQLTKFEGFVRYASVHNAL